jgi:small ligand-binding sensory domain FIST
MAGSGFAITMTSDNTMFAAAHAAADDPAEWSRLVLDCVTRLGPAAGRANLGFVYVTDLLAARLPDIVAMLRQTTGIKDWVGSVGIGISGTGIEYFDQPALAVMTASLPADAFRLMPHLRESLDELGPARDWLRQQAKQAGPLGAPMLGVVHADPRNERLSDLVSDLASEVGFLVGGLASSRGAMDQVAGTVARGGLSGVLLSPSVVVATGLSQGCSPIGPVRTVTAGRQNILMEIDDRPALDVFKQDIGEVLARRLENVAGHIHAAFPVAGSDTGDYLVRNLIGIDRERGWLAVGERVATGDRLLFVRRDRQAAEEDLVRMLQRVRRGTNAPPRAGIYFSCIARGPNLFGPESAELGLLRRELGEFPLVGMFCNGEISNSRLYGYTGVLALFL